MSGQQLPIHDAMPCSFSSGYLIRQWYSDQALAQAFLNMVQLGQGQAALFKLPVQQTLHE